MWYIHTIEYSTIERNGLRNKIAWLNPNNMLSEKSRKQKSTYHMLSFVWDSRKKQSKSIAEQWLSRTGDGSFAVWEGAQGSFWEWWKYLYLMVVVSQVYNFVKTHWYVLLKWVHLIVCKLYLNNIGKNLDGILPLKDFLFYKSIWNTIVIKLETPQGT